MISRILDNVAKYPERWISGALIAAFFANTAVGPGMDLLRGLSKPHAAEAEHSAPAIAPNHPKL